MSFNSYKRERSNILELYLVDVKENVKDKKWMRQALALAKEAGALGEVPVGAVVVLNGEIIGKGFNASISQNDPSHHAEVVAIRQAAKQIDNYRLSGASLFVTLEPCTMCFGLMVHSRIDRLVYATTEPRAGVLVSQLRLSEQSFYNHKVKVEGGLLAEESGHLLRSFFEARRLI